MDGTFPLFDGGPAMSNSGRGYSGLLADPAVRKERARKGGLAKTTVEFYVRKLVDAAQRLTDEQRDRLITAVRGGR